MSRRYEHNEDGRERAPERLVEDLRILYAQRIDVPPEVDRRILSMARKRLAKRRPRLVVLRWATAAAAAACLLLALVLWPQQRARLATAPARPPVPAEDVDRDGRPKEVVLCLRIVVVCGVNDD